MRVWGTIGAVRHRIVVIVVIAFCGMGSARADMQVVATFGNSGTHSVLVLAKGESNGTRSAAIILDHPSHSPKSDSGDVPNRMVVVFDARTWPTFEKIWTEERGSYTDPVEGTRLEISSAYETLMKLAPPSLLHDPRGVAIVISVTDKNGNSGSFEFSQEYRVAHRNMKDAIKAISDYLNQSTQ